MHPDFEAYLDHLRLTGRSDLTVRRYREVLLELETFTRGADPDALARQVLLQFAACRRCDGDPRTAAGVNLRVAVLRAAFSYLHKEGRVSLNPTGSLVGVRQPRRSPDYLTTAEMLRLLTHLKTRRTMHRIRDIVLGVVLWQTGLRVSEVARLTWGDLDPERCCLREVLVKGGHRRDVPLGEQTLAALEALRATSSAGTTATAPIFEGRRGKALSVRAIQALFATWRTELGWVRRLHPHLLRKTHATGALALGVDVATVADLLGHRDLRTVMAYAAVQDGPRRNALRRMGALVPGDLLTHLGVVPRAAANDVEEMTCVEEPFAAGHLAAGGLGRTRRVHPLGRPTRRAGRGRQSPSANPC